MPTLYSLAAKSRNKEKPLWCALFYLNLRTGFCDGCKTRPRQPAILAVSCSHISCGRSGLSPLCSPFLFSAPIRHPTDFPQLLHNSVSDFLHLHFSCHLFPPFLLSFLLFTFPALPDFPPSHSKHILSNYLLTVYYLYLIMGRDARPSFPSHPSLLTLPFSPFPHSPSALFPRCSPSLLFSFCFRFFPPPLPHLSHSKLLAASSKTHISPSLLPSMPCNQFPNLTGGVPPISTLED
jgi:hypothetical protein